MAKEIYLRLLSDPSISAVRIVLIPEKELRSVHSSSKTTACMVVDFEKTLSTAISVLVLLLVGWAAEQQNTLLAAVASTAPTGVPLSLFIVASRNPRDPAVLVNFTRSLCLGVFSTLVFAIAAHVAARVGMRLGGVLVAGFAGWALSWLALARLGA